MVNSQYQKSKNFIQTLTSSKSYISIRRKLVLLFCISLVMFFLTGKFNTNSLKSSAQVPVSFTFGAVGDLGAGNDTSGVLLAANSQNLNFFLAVGDLSYNEVTPESAWCDFVKARMGATFPFELLAGNHEDDGPDGLISNFAACLPDRIGNVTGVYGKEYYFDYPQTTPIARFIMISPNLTFPGEGTYSYTKGSTRYNWTANAIDSARAAGIKWVVVGIHKYCIAMVSGSCQIKADIMNLLIDKKVDLYFQGHDHAYARTKQLALNTTNCTGISAGSYNANCVVDDGTDNQYTKGLGTVLMTMGMGGSLNKQYTTDAEAAYFTRWMGNNFSPTNGFMKFTVTESQITAEFVKGQASSGTFTESYTITESGVPIATPSPSPTPTPTPSPSPSTLPSPSATPIPSPTPTTPTPTPTPTPQPTPTPGSAQTVNTNADTYVASDATGTNYGTAVALYIDGSPVKISYLKFDLTPYTGQILTSAKLRIKTTSGAYSGSPDTHVVKLVSDTSWTETGLTYNNRPTLSSILGSVSNTTFNTVYEINLDPSVVQSGLGNIFSVGIDSTGGDAFYFNSRETADDPQLILSF